MIIRLRPDLRVESGNGFNVVVEHMGGCRYDGLEILGGTLEIRNQHFHLSPGIPVLDGANGFGKMFCAAVREIVTGDGCDHRIPKSQRFDGVSYFLRLIFVRRFG